MFFRLEHNPLRCDCALDWILDYDTLATLGKHTIYCALDRILDFDNLATLGNLSYTVR